MNKERVRNVLLAAFTAMALSISSNAQIRSASGKLIVMSPQNLPDAAQVPGEDLFLYPNRDGGYYLYEEQQNGSRLLIFDVTDPSRIKLKATQQLAASGPFDFIDYLSDKTALVRYRNGKGAAILDLRDEKRPALHEVSALKDNGSTLIMDKPGASEVDQAERSARPARKEYEVIDTASRDQPIVLAIVRQVEHQLQNEDTGTTFLLNREGLTIVRRIDVEQAFLAHQRQLTN